MGFEVGVERKCDVDAHASHDEEAQVVDQRSATAPTTPCLHGGCVRELIDPDGRQGGQEPVDQDRGGIAPESTLEDRWAST